MADAIGNLRIGELAAHAGVRVDTVRFYEKRGLLPRPTRLPSGYRSYQPADLDRLRFIRRAQELGFTLDEIAELLRLSEDSRARCGDVQDVAQAKLSDVRHRIEDLLRIQDALGRLAECCDGEAELADCPLLDCLRTSADIAKDRGGIEDAAPAIEAVD